MLTAEDAVWTTWKNNTIGEAATLLGKRTLRRLANRHRSCCWTSTATDHAVRTDIPYTDCFSLNSGRQGFSGGLREKGKESPRGGAPLTCPERPPPWSLRSLRRSRGRWSTTSELCS